jgi:WhiB family redox-sensing transcriptional regulator
LWAQERPNLDALVVRPGWMRDGLCREYPDIDFFFERGESTAPAKAICSRCPVSGQCLAYALEQGPHLQGVWAGTSPRERRQHAGLVVSSGSA